MTAQRTEIVNSKKVEEFYWNGRAKVYIDNQRFNGTFNEAVLKEKGGRPMKDDRMVDTRDVIGKTVTIAEKKEPMNAQERIKKLDRKFFDNSYILGRCTITGSTMLNNLHSRDTALIHAIAEAVNELQEDENCQCARCFYVRKAREVVNSFAGGENGNKDKD
jgi:glycyl-tRNA synthetase beta subunit